MADNSVISRSIDWLRFPCAAAVVLLHAFGQPLAGNDCISFRYGAYDTIRILFSEGLCRIAVPIFFFISGYLFFVRLEHWDTKAWVGKLKKRVKTLLVPYLLWNIIAFLMLLAIDCGKMMIKNCPPQFQDLQSLFCNAGGLRLFWDAKSGYPLNDPLWFIRNLLVFVTVAPIIFLFLKKLKIMGLSLLYIAYQLCQGTIAVLWLEGLFFFSFGAFFSICMKDFYLCFTKFRYIPAIVCVLLLIAIVFTYSDFPVSCEVCRRLLTLIGTVAVIAIVGKYADNGRLKGIQLLSKSSFLVYAAHGLILPYLLFAMRRTLPQTQLVLILDYFIAPFLTIIILVFAYKLLNRLMPKTSLILLGGR